MEILVTRFNNETYMENKKFRENNNIVCIYSSPVKISENILPNEKLIVLEMNNSINNIEGIGLIKNKLYLKEKYKIYGDRNYNRYTYKSKYRIDKNEFTSYEVIIIKKLESPNF